MISKCLQEKTPNLLHSTSPMSKPLVFYSLFHLHVSLPFTGFVLSSWPNFFYLPIKKPTALAVLFVRELLWVKPHSGVWPQTSVTTWSQRGRWKCPATGRSLWHLLGSSSMLERDPNLPQHNAANTPRLSRLTSSHQGNQKQKARLSRPKEGWLWGKLDSRWGICFSFCHFCNLGIITTFLLQLTVRKMERLTWYAAISFSLGCFGADLIFLMTSGSHLNGAERKTKSLPDRGVTRAEEMHLPALKHKGELFTAAEGNLDRHHVTTLTVVCSWK